MLKYFKTSIFGFFVLILSCSASTERGKDNIEEPKDNIVQVVNFDNQKVFSNVRKSKNASLEIGKGAWRGQRKNYGVIKFQPFGETEMKALNAEMRGDVDAEKENPADISAGSSVWAEFPIQHIISNNEALGDYSVLRFSTYNPGNQPISYNFNLKDKRGSQRPIPHFVTLAPGEEKTVEIRLQESPYRPRVDLNNRYIGTSSKNVTLMEFEIPFLVQNVSFYVSNIELIRESAESTKKSIQRASHGGVQGSFELIPKSSMEQIFLDKSKFNFLTVQENKIYAAKNEQEGIQIVIVPGQGALSNVKWALSPFKNENGQTIPSDVSMVGFVETKIQPRYYTEFNGWYPDPILDSIYQVANIAAGEVLPLYLKADVPTGAAPGEYTAVLSVETQSGTKTMDVHLEVWDFELPMQSSNKFLTQFYRLNLSTMSQFLAPKNPANTFNQRAKAQTEMFENWMLKNRMQPGNIYAGSPPSWNAARLKDLVDRGLAAVNLSYMRIDRKNSDKYNEKEHWERVEKQIEGIKKYIPVLKEAGVWDNKSVLKYIFLFDEWPGNKSDIVFKTAKRLKDEFPEISLITTMSDHLYGVGKENGDLIDIWIPHVDILQRNKMYIDHVKSSNRKFGWYLAVGAYAPYPNVWVENKVIESRLSMGALSYKYDTPLFVYWAVNSWFNNKPSSLDKGPKTSWKPDSYGSKAKNVANGEGSLFYARTSKKNNLGARPVPTLRSENLRDGLEDFEYYVLLKNLYEKHGVRGDGNIVKDEVLENVGTFTYDPQVLENERIRIAKEILKYNK